ncbi:hypothetical protein HDV02_005459 [Globomyces sp. JEL0801]|nr:hypothetical protein HDV02_005459 [Globomyces sp. JEL0801]
MVNGQLFDSQPDRVRQVQPMLPVEIHKRFDIDPDQMVAHYIAFHNLESDDDLLTSTSSKQRKVLVEQNVKQTSQSKQPQKQSKSKRSKPTKNNKSPKEILDEFQILESPLQDSIADNVQDLTVETETEPLKETTTKESQSLSKMKQVDNNIRTRTISVENPIESAMSDHDGPLETEFLTVNNSETSISTKESIANNFYNEYQKTKLEFDLLQKRYDRLHNLIQEGDNRFSEFQQLAEIRFQDAEKTIQLLQIENLKYKNLVSSSNVIGLQNKLDESEEKQATFKTEIQMLMDKLQDKEKQKKTDNDLIEVLRKEKGNLEDTIVGLKKNNVNELTEKQQLQKKLEGFEDSVKDMIKEHDNSKVELLNKLKRSKLEKQDLKVTNEHYQSQIKELKETIEQLTQQKHDLNLKIDGLKSLQSDSFQNNQNLNLTMIELKSSNERYVMDIQNLETQMKELKIQNSHLSKVNQELKSKVKPSEMIKSVEKRNVAIQAVDDSLELEAQVADTLEKLVEMYELMTGISIQNIDTITKSDSNASNPESNGNTFNSFKCEVQGVTKGTF